MIAGACMIVAPAIVIIAARMFIAASVIIAAYVIAAVCVIAGAGDSCSMFDWCCCMCDCCYCMSCLLQLYYMSRSPHRQKHSVMFSVALCSNNLALLSRNLLNAFYSLIKLTTSDHCVLLPLNQMIRMEFGMLCRVPTAEFLMG